MEIQRNQLLSKRKELKEISDNLLKEVFGMDSELR